MVMPCGFESHLSHQKIQIPQWVSGFFAAQMGLERPLRKHAGGMFLGRGRVPQSSDASRRDVDEIGICPMPKTVGTGVLFQKSYKNTRTKNWADPFGSAQFLLLRMGFE